MSSMSIKTFMKVAQKLPANKSVMLRGIHGIGKSQLVRQLAKIIQKLEKLDEFPVIDDRLGQKTEGDVIGLPSTDGQVTRFNPPERYKMACMKPCMLFLDELNRATPEVMQAVFQLALDREINGHKLHPKSRVFTAINHSHQYIVNELDPALLDRFWVIDLEPSIEDFLDWARSKEDGGGNLNQLVVDFIAQNSNWADPEKNVEPGKKTTSRRSWEHLNTALVSSGLVNDPDDPLFYAMCLGFVGTEASIAFSNFAKAQDAQVSGEDILERYTKVKKKIAKMGVEAHNTCIGKVSHHIINKLETDRLNADQIKNLAAFTADLGPEHVISLWSALTKPGMEKIEMIRTVHAAMMEHVLAVFDMKPGELGMKMTPNLPGFLKQKSEPTP